MYDYLLSLDFDKSLGAREISRLIDNHIKIPLSEILLFKHIPKQAIINIACNNGKISFILDS